MKKAVLIFLAIFVMAGFAGKSFACQKQIMLNIYSSVYVDKIYVNGVAYKPLTIIAVASFDDTIGLYTYMYQINIPVSCEGNITVAGLDISTGKEKNYFAHYDAIVNNE